MVPVTEVRTDGLQEMKAIPAWALIIASIILIITCTIEIVLSSVLGSFFIMR